jgi:glycosyltransferase involved in cell wall biosynthesis
VSHLQTIAPDDRVSLQAARQDLDIVLASAESLAQGFAPARFVDSLSQELQALGHKVTVAGLDTGSYHRSGFTQRVWRYIHVNWSVIKRLFNCDVIIARGHFAHLPWAVVALALRKPVFHIMNGFIFDAMTTHKMTVFARAIVRLSYRLQFRTASGFICVTQEIADQIKQRYDVDHVHVIRNGVDTRLFYPAAEQADQKPYAVFPSSLAPWHDLETIFQATEHPDWPSELSVSIVGDGAQAEAVRIRADGHPRVRYEGLMHGGAYENFIRHASLGLCIVNSVDGREVREVFPLKLSELMASGLPVVVTDLAGQREIVRQSGAGMVIPEHDPGALARAARDIYRSPDKAKMGKAAALYAEANLSWRSAASRLSEIMKASVFRTRSVAGSK